MGTGGVCISTGGTTGSTAPCAASGILAVPNATFLMARNQGATADLTLIGTNNAPVNSVQVGDVTAVNDLFLNAATQVQINAPIATSTGHILISGAAPTISSGFGTSPSILTNNGPASFSVNVGTGGAASTGVIGLPTATNGWTCWANDVTTPGTNETKQTGSTTTTASFTNFNTTTGAATAWTASDTLTIGCMAR